MLLRRAPEAAAKVTADALRLDPNNVLALRLRATALFALERADELLEIAEALERTAPARGWSALARGAHHILRKEFEFAAPWLTKAEADPDNETSADGCGCLADRRASGPGRTRIQGGSQ